MVSCTGEGVAIERVIIHVDMDAFYASVEELDRPELHGKAVVVGGRGDPMSRGVVSAASYEARKYGVHSAMPLRTAHRLCPHAVFLPVRMDRYVEVSRQVRSILLQYTPLVEPISVDEAFLDISGSRRLHGDPEAIGRNIKEQIRRETGLTASIGIAPNKFLAKLASDLDKPDGFVVIKEGEARHVLRDLPISRLWGVGKVTEKKLKRYGIETIGQLTEIPQEILEERYGKLGARLYELARGIDDREVVPREDPKSIGHETTFEEDIDDEESIRRALILLSDQVGRRLRNESLSGRTISLKVRFGDFKTLTRETTIENPTDVAEVIFETVWKLYRKVYTRGKVIRLVGVAVSNLYQEGHRQLSLFDTDTDKRREKHARLEKTLDQIIDKMGDDAIRRAGTLTGRRPD